MVEYLGIIQLAGKYMFLAALYVFVIWIFRSLFATLQMEQSAAKRQPPQQRQRKETSMRPAQSRTAHKPRPVQETKPVPDEAQPPPSSTKPRLVVTNPGQSDLAAGTEFPLTAAVTMGRGDENSVRIPDRYASTQHAMIFVRDDRRILRDRGSTNGTTRNGTPVSRDVVLNDGDIIGIGTVKLKYHSGQ